MDHTLGRVSRRGILAAAAVGSAVTLGAPSAAVAVGSTAPGTLPGAMPGTPPGAMPGTPAGTTAGVPAGTPAGVPLVVTDRIAAAVTRSPRGGAVKLRLASDLHQRLVAWLRFSSCGFWTGEQCGLGARLATSYRQSVDRPGGAGRSGRGQQGGAGPAGGAGQSGRGQQGGAGPAELPRCAIRRRCRWYAEQGPAACSPCSYVITDAH